MYDIRKKNRILFLQHQLMSTKFTLSKSLTLDEHHSMITNTSELSLFAYSKSPTRNKMNFPTNLSTLIAKKKISPLNLPFMGKSNSLKNIGKSSSSEPIRGFKSRQQQYPKFESLFNRGKTDIRTENEKFKKTEKLKKKLDLIIKNRMKMDNKVSYYNSRNNSLDNDSNQFQFVGLGRNFVTSKSQKDIKSKSSIEIALSKIQFKKWLLWQNQNKIYDIVNKGYNRKFQIDKSNLYKMLNKLRFKKKECLEIPKNSKNLNQKQNYNKAKRNLSEGVSKQRNNKEIDKEKENEEFDSKKDFTLESERVKVKFKKEERVKVQKSIKNIRNKEQETTISKSKKSNEIPLKNEKSNNLQLSIIESANHRKFKVSEKKIKNEENFQTFLFQPKSSKNIKSKNIFKYDEKNNNKESNCININSSKKPTLFLTLYSIRNLSNKQISFLSELIPNSISMKDDYLSSNNSKCIELSKKFIKNLIKFKPSKPEPIVKFLPNMFIDTKKNIVKDAMRFQNINNILLKDLTFMCYKDNKCEGGMINYILSKYLKISHKLISDFMYDTKENNLKWNIKLNKKYPFIRGKSASNIELLSLFGKLILHPDNIIYYQKLIFQDSTSLYDVRWSKEKFQNIKNLNEFRLLYKNELPFPNDKSVSSTDSYQSQFERTPVKSKKKRVNLKLLQKAKIFNVNAQKKVNKYTEKDYSQYITGRLDEKIKSLIIQICNTKENDQLKNEFKELLYKLLTLCIINLQEKLFFHLFNKFRQVFDINYTDRKYNTMLIIASKTNALKIIEFLLMNGANPNSQNIFGNTAMHYAISYKYYDQIDLLQKFKARQDLMNIYGKSPLDCMDGVCEYSDYIE